MNFTSTSSGTCALAGILVTVAGSHVFADGDSYSLKPRYEDGARRYLENSIEVEQAMDGGPMGEMKFDVSQVYGLWEKVEKSSDNKTEISLTFDRAARTMKSVMFGEAAYDTDDPLFEDADPQLKTLLDVMIGESVKMTVDDQAKMIEFSGMDALAAKVSEKAVMNMHWQSMQQEFNDKAARRTWETELLQFVPEKEVRVGDSWTASSSNEHPMLGVLVSDMTYTLKEVTDDESSKIALIDLVGQMKRKSVEGEENPPKIEGAITGTIKFDIANGALVKRNSTLKSNIEVRQPGMPAESPAMKVKITAQTNLVMHDETQRRRERAEAQKITDERRKAAEAEAAADAEDDDDDEEDDDDDEDDDD